MEKYKKTLVYRICIIIFCFIIILVGCLLKMNGVLSPQDTDVFSEFHQGFQLGIIALVESMFIYFMGRYIVTLQKPEELKKLYYAEHDERKRTIREKSGGYTIFLCAIAILIVAIIAGYFNEIVFYSLVGCSFFLFITRKILILYYSYKI